MKAVFEQEIPLPQSIELMRRELWRVESQYSSYGIGPGENPISFSHVGSATPAVNIVGLVESEKGVGEAVRTTLRSLDAAEVTYALNNFADPGSENLDRSFPNFSSEHPHKINLLHIGPDVFAEFVKQAPANYLKDRFNIACWAWETSDFPGEWEDHFKHLDEIWVPSNFSLDAISRVAPIPMVRIPHSIPLWLPIEPVDRAQFGIPPEAFAFLFVFDFASSYARKNPMGVINAFKSAFNSDENAMLILKCAHGEVDPAAVEAIEKVATGGNIRIIHSVLPRTQISALMNLCDCYLSLHRSEGFGLTIAEAMSLGKPVIATDYSGNTDFMNSSNSFPVRYHLVAIEQGQGQYHAGCSWAEPDTDHAAELMRQVYHDQSAAARIGQIARRDIVQNLNPLIVGEMMRNRLKRHKPQ